MGDFVDQLNRFDYLKFILLIIMLVIILYMGENQYGFQYEF